MKPWAVAGVARDVHSFVPMHPPFVDSDSRLPENADREVLMPSQWGRLLAVAIVIAMAASAAALLVT